MTLIDLLVYAYSVNAISSCVSFAPQFLVLWRDKKSSAKDISLLSWGLWCAETTISVSYAIFIVKRPEMIFVTGVVCFWCFSIFSLALYRRCAARQISKSYPRAFH